MDAICAAPLLKKTLLVCYKHTNGFNMIQHFKVIFNGAVLHIILIRDYALAYNISLKNSIRYSGFSLRHWSQKVNKSKSCLFFCV